jgi:hypothetical protein
MSMNEIFEERCFLKLTDAGPIRVWRWSPVEGGPVQFFGDGLLLMPGPTPRHPPMQIPFRFPIPGDTPDQAIGVIEADGEAFKAAFKAGAEAKQAEVMAEMEKQRNRVVIAGQVPQGHRRGPPVQ